MFIQIATPNCNTVYSEKLTMIKKSQFGDPGAKPPNYNLPIILTHLCLRLSMCPTASCKSHQYVIAQRFKQIAKFNQ